MQSKFGGFINKARDTAAGVGGQASAMLKVGPVQSRGARFPFSLSVRGIALLWGRNTDTTVLTTQEGSSRASTGGTGLMQSFSLPGESAKAAKILKGFLGQSSTSHRSACSLGKKRSPSLPCQ
jgi:hypothetical protein